MATVNLRIDEALKEKSYSILKEQGIAAVISFILRSAISLNDATLKSSPGSSISIIWCGIPHISSLLIFAEPR